MEIKCGGKKKFKKNVLLIEASKHKITYLVKGLRVLVPVDMQSYFRIFWSKFCSCLAFLLIKIFIADGMTKKSSSTTVVVLNF